MRQLDHSRGQVGRATAESTATTISDKSEAIVRAINDATVPSGATVGVGGSLESRDPTTDCEKLGSLCQSRT